MSNILFGETPESKVQKLKPDTDEDDLVIYQELRGVQ